MKIKDIVIALSVLFFLQSCANEEKEKVNEYLVSSTEILSYTADNIQSNFRLAGLSELAALATYEIEIYKVEYNTELNGEAVVASGLIAIPLTTDPLPMISLQHGTIAANNQAPSVSVSSYAQFSWFSSFGYIMAIPDFIGYGSSSDIFHPYYDEESSGRSVTDMLLAAQELAVEENITFNGDLFLAGYSEGGYVTMATHKRLEENSSEYSNFNLVASAPASGGYDVTGMANYLFSLDEYSQPFFIAFVAQAYTETYNWSQPLSLYFNEPFATDIPLLIDGVNTSGEINNRLTTNINYMIKEEFRTGINSNSEYEHIKNAFEENSLTDWVPQSRMYLYHGTSDVTVPYDNSVETFNKLKANGALDIELIDLEGDHSTAIIPYLTDVILKFSDLK